MSLKMDIEVKYLIVRGLRWECVSRQELYEVQGFGDEAVDMVDFIFLQPATNRNIQFRIEPAKQTSLKQLRQAMAQTIEDQLTTEEYQNNVAEK